MLLIMAYLIKPNELYKDAFLDGMHSLIDNKMYPDVSDDILLNTAFPKNINTNDIKRSTFWLMDSEKWLGVITIRHTPSANKDFPPELVSHISYDIRPEEQGKGYGKEVLKLGLVEAKKLGLKEVFIVCNEDNLRSKGVIESNGGKLIYDIYVPTIGQNVRKYEIKF